MKQHQPVWQVGHTDCLTEYPTEFVSATVPGAVNLDWATAKNMPDWKYGENFKQYAWMEDCFWVYRTNLPEVSLSAGQRLVFVCGGVDYACDIRIAQQTVCHHEGMFSGFEVDVSDYSAGAELTVVLLPAPKDPQGKKGTRQEAAQCCKPAVSYGWDWHPRLIPLGIWQESFFEVQEPNRLLSASVTYQLAENFSTAQVHFLASSVGEGALEFCLSGPDDSVLYQGEQATFSLQSPLLWWPNGYGEPTLYHWRVTFRSSDNVCTEKCGRIGFRQVELVMNEGGWDEPQEFPKGRSVAPITLQINGVAVFAKGSNWVNPEVFPGMITKETYRPLIQLARDANFNIFRCWGGAIINKDSFFELCDENGIMVWQEFMLACNNYRGTPAYLKVLEQEARAIITRLKGYPSLVLWCGGNELFNEWSGMTDQSLALRLLGKLCYELDIERPYLMTSPVYGMAHGCYLFKYPDGREVFEVMPSVKYTAYTEFGVPSISNLDCCLSFAKKNEIFPLRKNDITIAHHAFESWHAAEDTWCGINTISHYLGEPESLEQLIEWSQWMQGEGYKCIFEEARRQKPYCSMAINWCYNEPWPALANNTIINYPAAPKASYHEVAQACRPTLASARIPHFSWHAGEQFTAELWMLCDGRNAISSGVVEVFLELPGEVRRLLTWNYDALNANQNLAGPTVRTLLPGKIHATDDMVELNSSSRKNHRGQAQQMRLVLQAGEYSSTYTLILY